MTWVNNGCMSYKPGPGQAMQAELEALTIGSANGETGVTESFLNIYMPYNQLQVGFWPCTYGNKFKSLQPRTVIHFQFLGWYWSWPNSGEDTGYLTKPITMEEMQFFVKKTIPYRCLPACMAISLCLFAWLAQADEEELRQSMKRSPPKSTKNTPVKSTALAKKPRNQAGDQVLWKQMVLKTSPQKGVSNI